MKKAIFQNGVVVAVRRCFGENDVRAGEMIVPEGMACGVGYTWNGNGFLPPVKPVDLDEEKARLLAAVPGHIDRASRAVLARYPSAEVASWPTKAIEAAAILAGETDPARVPIIAAEAAPGEWAVLAASIVENAARMAAIAGQLAGLRRAWCDALKAAETVEAARLENAARLEALRAIFA